MRPSLLTFHLLLSLLSSSPAQVVEEKAVPSGLYGRLPYNGYLPGAAPDGYSVTLVRDRRTGKPLAGVAVRRYRESVDPRVLEAPLLGEGQTDSHGLVVLPVKVGSGDAHWIFDRSGLAVRGEYGVLAPEVVELRPGRELHGKVVGRLGTPAGGVRVDLFLGCGHSPTVRRAWTQGNGRFVLRDIDPGLGTLWFPAPGLAGRNVMLAAGTELHPQVIHTRPGIVLRGRVVDGRGRPLEGIVVRSAQETRGPAARSGADGKFALEGYAPDAGLRLCGPDRRDVWIGRGELLPGRAVRLVYPSREEEDRPEPDGVPFKVRVLDQVTGRLVPGAVIALEEPGTGRIRSYDLAEEEAPEVPPGRYELHMVDPFASHTAPPRSVEVAAGQLAPFTIRATPRPRLQVERSGFPDHRGTTLYLELVAARMLLPDDPREPVHLPEKEPAVVRAEADGLVRYFTVGPVERGVRKVSVRWPEPRRIVVECDPRWRLSLRHAHAWSVGKGVLATHAAGRVTLVVRDKDLGEQEIPLNLVGKPGGELRVGGAALRPPGVLTVRYGDTGQPAAGVKVFIDGEWERLDTQGGLRSWRLKKGAAIRVCHGNYVELRRVLKGPGPYALRWGAAAMHLKVTDPPAFVACVDGRLFEGKGGKLTVAGLDATTPHLVILSARGYRSTLFRVGTIGNEGMDVPITLERDR